MILVTSKVYHFVVVIAVSNPQDRLAHLVRSFNQPGAGIGILGWQGYAADLVCTTSSKNLLHHFTVVRFLCIINSNPIRLSYLMHDLSIFRTSKLFLLSNYTLVFNLNFGSTAMDEIIEILVP